MSQNMVNSDTTNYITRAEYEARHSELRTELIRLSTENDTYFKWVVAENDTLRKDVQAKFDTLTNMINAQAKIIDAGRVSAWKLVAISVINFMIGGGLIAFLNYLHFPK